MSSESSTDANRKAALEKLKFKKSSRREANTVSQPPSSPILPWHAQQSSPNAPPAHSRDATVPSRYVPTTPVSTGRVLVPNSSPAGPDSLHRGNQSLFDQDPSGSIPGLNHPNTWRYSATPTVDSLSAPSGFTTGSSGTDASFSRSWMTNGRTAPASSYGQGTANGEPPRKRMNRGESPVDSADPFHVPGSPEIQRPGQRRKINALTSMSSDESWSEAGRESGPSKPRIVRGQRSEALPSTPETPDADTDIRYKTFVILNQSFHSEAKIRAAWTQAKAVETEASALLGDPNFMAPKPVSVAKPKVKVVDEIGRVKEVEEATKAERARRKEMGKKSAIYASSTLPPITPPVSRVNGEKLDTPLTPLTPASPEITVPRGKRRKRKVIDSDDDDDDEPNIVEESKGDDDDDAEADYDDSDGPSDLELDEGASVAEALVYFNTASAESLQELTGCSLLQAQTIVELRPYPDEETLRVKLGQGKKKAGPAGISPRMFEDSAAVFEGYGIVDHIVSKCEVIGEKLKEEISKWTGGVNLKGKGKEGGTPSCASPDADDGVLSLSSRANLVANMPDYFISSQPASLSSDVQLKEYQLVGINWLNLLYRERHNCILADEMGLGKTVQVISFFAHLKDNGSHGPHLIVVPSSTLENWIREFKRFAPSISVSAYYADKNERSRVRQRLLDTQRSKVADGWEVLVTTYNLAQGDERDRKFFRKMPWQTCVFDEGHVLKNFQSQRYRSLVKVTARWRLLLTGTPLQNNLQELMSLMNFILPQHFKGRLELMRPVFRTKGDSKVTLLAQERVSRAKKMMTPFVLRRRKDQVLQDLPKKIERIEWCEMTPMQKSIYNDALRRSRKTIFDLEDGTAADAVPATKVKAKPAKKTRAAARPKDKMFLENSSNVLMDLRKAASHPMLFRRLYTDETLSAIARLLLKEPDFKKRGAIYDYVKEDMEVMTDSELQVFCATYKSTRRFLQGDDCFLQAGKVKVLMRLLRDYQSQGRRVLVFSQFTQILDILQKVLEKEKIEFLVLTGSTPVDVRQSLVDEFTVDESILVFLLSTKAGGMGINLTAASVVIMFDQDFNPHNDKQAQDRAYRIGQKRDVDVVKLITKSSIEEDILELGRTKLALDEAVAGEEGDERVEKEMKTSLMNVVRKKLEVDEELDEPSANQTKTTGESPMDVDEP